MLVVMKSRTTDDQFTQMLKFIDGMGLKSYPAVGEERTIIVAGEKLNGATETLRSFDYVERVVPIRTPYKLASTEVKAGTIVRARDFEAGNRRVGVIAGPCSVEGEKQVVQIARAVRASGATALRGGAWKPRTSPHSFQGLGEKGLEFLEAAREATGLAIVTEVMTPEHVQVVAERADILQIGARNMHNSPLLQAVGSCGKPVLLKRGPAASMDEFLLAAEYILARGNDQVILCERGIRTFEDHTRFTLPLATVPYLHERTHLPVVVDPSHGTGKASLVATMARAAVAAGADGLMVEVHPSPEEAWCDGDQSITPEAFGAMMMDCRRVAEAIGRSLGRGRDGV